MIEITIDEYKERIPTVVVVDDGNQYDPMFRYIGQIKKANKWLGKTILGKNLMDVLNKEEIDLDLFNINSITNQSAGEESGEDSGEDLGEGESGEITDVESKVNELIELCKDVIIFKSYIALLPYLNLSDTGSGFVVARNDVYTPASTERTNGLANILNEQLNDSCDDMFDFLESNDIFHHIWKTSPAYSLMTNTLIPTYKEFSEMVKFEGNRFDLIKLKPEMYNAIYLQIRSYISLNYVEYLVNAIREDSLSENDLLVIKELKMAYAHFVLSNTHIAESHILRVQSTMIENIDNYLLYKNSKEYAQYLKNNNATTDGSILKMIM